MRTTNKKTLLFVSVLVLSLSLLSAAPRPTRAQSLAPSAELQVVGGDKCSAAWGLGLGLAVAALSPCSVVCAALAWYDLALIGAFCE
jgi:Na+/phosphate symporter